MTFFIREHQIRQDFFNFLGKKSYLRIAAGIFIIIQALGQIGSHRLIVPEIIGDRSEPLNDVHSFTQRLDSSLGSGIRIVIHLCNLNAVERVCLGIVEDDLVIVPGNTRGTGSRDADLQIAVVGIVEIDTIACNRDPLVQKRIDVTHGEFSALILNLCRCGIIREQGHGKQGQDESGYFSHNVGYFVINKRLLHKRPFGIGSVSDDGDMVGARLFGNIQSFKRSLRRIELGIAAQLVAGVEKVYHHHAFIITSYF